MNCPYCLEEINPQALVCKHCGRDLFFITPILTKIDKLESEIGNLKNQLNDLNTNLTSIDRTQKSVVYPKPTFFLSILFASLIGSLFYFLYRNYGENNIYLIILIFSPLPFGFWLGYKWKSIKIVSLIKAGFFIGLFNYLGTMIISGQILPSDKYDLIFGIFLQILGGALLYLSGGMIGSWFARRNGDNQINNYAGVIARNIVLSKTSQQNNLSVNEIENKVERLKKIIDALAPILTFIASILTALLTYFATRK